MDQAARIREKIDLVSLISEYLKLKKAGRNFTTVCPFHNEKTPSFVVSPERQIWHCFGCGKGGDAYTFLMEYENLEFIEALRILAKKAGVKLTLGDSEFSTSKKEKIYNINSIVAKYYNYVLLNHPSGKEAMDYLIGKRGLSERLIKTFNIGFAPAGRYGLTNYLTEKKKTSKIDLVDAGLSFQREGRIFDFFRNRVIFPLLDHRGNVIGFSGRKINDRTSGPKYINTKETLVYHKGSTFFGLNLAKESIKKEQFSIVMEGEFDVISAFSQGIKNSVAIKGTAFTEQQALLLSRFSPKVSLCLDEDQAGRGALKKSVPILEKRGLSISVISLNGKDADEVIKKDPMIFKKAVKEDIEVYDYLIGKMTKEFDASTAGGKKKVSDEILPLISAIQNEVLKEYYLKKLSGAIDTSFESLERQLYKKNSEKKETTFKKIQVKDRREMLEEYLLALILQHQNPKTLFIKSNDILGNYEFKILSTGKIFKEIAREIKKTNKLSIKTFSKKLPKELVPVYDKCFLIPLPKFGDDIKYEAEVLRSSRELKIFYLKEKVRKLSSEIKEKDADLGEIEKTREEIANITSQLVQH